MSKSTKTLKRIRKSYTRLESLLNKEADEKKERHCSPLFSNNSNAPVVPVKPTENIFYGYRTTLKKDKATLLTVKTSRNTSNRPMTAKLSQTGAKTERPGGRNRDLIIKPKRPMTAAREFRTTVKKYSKRPGTAMASARPTRRPLSSSKAGSLGPDMFKTSRQFASLAPKPHFLQARPVETTSSFFNDDFSFGHTMNSQNSRDVSSPKKPGRKGKPSKVLLYRKKTQSIGLHETIHHGTLDMTLNELKNIFKLKYDQRNEKPIDGIIFQLGITEN